MQPGGLTQPENSIQDMGSVLYILNLLAFSFKIVEDLHLCSNINYLAATVDDLE